MNPILKIKSELLSERDSQILGAKLEAPFFFGAFKEFQKVGNDPFATVGWIDHCRAIINQWNSPYFGFRQSTKSVIKKLFGLSSNRANLFQIIKELLEKKETVSIVDIGGGFGDNYFFIRSELGSLCSRINYLVVDNKVQCDLGVDLWEDVNIKFTTELPEQKSDLILIIGTLQYIENWESFISIIANLANNLIYVSRTPINVGGPSFVSVQSICPEFGESAQLKIGESNVNVINSQALDLAFKENGFLLKDSVDICDYTENFKRLSGYFGEIRYIDKYFIRVN